MNFRQFLHALNNWDNTLSDEEKEKFKVEVISGSTSDNRFKVTSICKMGQSIIIDAYDSDEDCRKFLDGEGIK